MKQEARRNGIKMNSPFVKKDGVDLVMIVFLVSNGALCKYS